MKDMSMPLARRTWSQHMLGPWRRQCSQPCPWKHTVPRHKAPLSRPCPWRHGSFALELGLEPWEPWPATGTRWPGHHLAPARHFASRLHPSRFVPAQQMQPERRLSVQASVGRGRKAQSSPHYLSPHVVTNINQLQPGYMEAAIFQVFSLPWLQDFPPTEHVSIGNQAAHILRSSLKPVPPGLPIVCAVVFSPKQKALVTLHFPQPNSPGAALPRTLELADRWERLDPQPRQAVLLPGGEVGVAIRAKAFEQHCQKVLNEWWRKTSIVGLFVPQKLYSEGGGLGRQRKEVGKLLTDVRFTGIVFDNAPAIAIDFTHEGCLPVLDVLELLPPETSLVGAKVRTPIGITSTVASAEPLTEELRQELLRASSREENRAAICKAPEGELVLGLESPTGARYKWVSSQLDLVSHPGSYQATMALQDLETSVRSRVRLKPEDRQRRIQEIADTFIKIDDPFLVEFPVGSTARWSSGANRCFGSVDLSSHSRKMGGGVSLPMDAPQYKLADALLSHGVRKLGRPPAALAVLYAAEDSSKVQELKSVAGPMLAKLMQALGDREGSPPANPIGSDREGCPGPLKQDITEQDATRAPVTPASRPRPGLQGTLQESMGGTVEDMPALGGWESWPGVLKQDFSEWETTDGVKSMAGVAEEMLSRGIKFVLCCSGHRKGSREGEELWEALKRECFSRGMPTQSVFGDTLRNPYSLEPLDESGLKLVVGNVICSVATKLGHAPWTLTPLSGTPVDFIVGIDVCRGFVGEEDRAAGVAVYTREGEPVLTKLTHKECDGETVSEEFLKESIPVGTIAKSKVVVIRHGPFRGAETRQIQEILKSCGAKGTFVEVIERSNYRVFSTVEDHAPVDSYIVLQPNEWLLVASKPYKGTAQPLRVLLKQNDLGHSMEQVVGLVAWLRRLPSVSLAAPKLPGPLHLADMMAGTRSRIGEAADHVDNRGLL